MKRTLAIILAMVLCFQFFGMEASAVEAGISLSAAEGLSGEQVSVNVKITTCPLVQIPSGSKVVSVAPSVMPFVYAQRIGS